MKTRWRYLVHHLLVKAIRAGLSPGRLVILHRERMIADGSVSLLKNIRRHLNTGVCTESCSLEEIVCWRGVDQNVARSQQTIPPLSLIYFCSFWGGFWFWQQLCCVTGASFQEWNEMEKYGELKKGRKVKESTMEKIIAPLFLQYFALICSGLLLTSCSLPPMHLGICVWIHACVCVCVWRMWVCVCLSAGMFL